MMTYNEFFAALAELKHQRWTVDESGDIRNRRGCCPVVAVARSLGAAKGVHPVNAQTANTSLRERGLRREQVQKIIIAADNFVWDLPYREWRTERELRLRLLDVLDLLYEPSILHK